MPRCARIKSPHGIYHIMIRSISEVMLFADSDDKDYFLKLIQKYQNIFFFKVYGYCIMSNHAHLLIDCCGADISKFMHNINQCYAMYVNKKYERHGHCLGGRFKSVLIKDDAQLLAVSAYIHCNPKDIKGYNIHIENYKYSSFGIFLGIMKDPLNILNTNYILQYFNSYKSSPIKKYFNFVTSRINLEPAEDIEFNFEKSEYRSERKILIRNFSPEQIIEFIKSYTNQYFSINIKHIHKNNYVKSIAVLLMRSLCDFTYKNICSIFGNISSSSISRLCNKGYDIIMKYYKNIIPDFISLATKS